MTSNVAGLRSAKEPRVAVGSAGLVAGSLLGGVYVLWALLVISGGAQSLMNVISTMHVIRPVYVVEQIEPMRLAALALLSAAVGYFLGGAFAVIWNNTVRLKD